MKLSLYIWTIVLLGLVFSTVAQRPVKRKRLRVKKRRKTALPKLPTPLPMIANETVGYKAVVHTVPPIFHMTLPVTGSSAEIEQYADVVSEKISGKVHTNPPVITTARQDLENAKSYSTRPAAKPRYFVTASTVALPILDTLDAETTGLDISNIVDEKYVNDLKNIQPYKAILEDKEYMDLPENRKAPLQNMKPAIQPNRYDMTKMNAENFIAKNVEANQPHSYGVVDDANENPESQRREESQPQGYKVTPIESQSYGERVEFLQHGNLRPKEQSRAQRTDPRHRPFRPKPPRPMYHDMYEQPHFNQDPYFPRYPSYHRGDLYDFHHFNHPDMNFHRDSYNDYNKINQWERAYDIRKGNVYDKLDDLPSEPEENEHVIHDDLKIPRRELYSTNPEEKVNEIEDHKPPHDRFQFPPPHVFDPYFDHPMMPWEYRRPYGYRDERRPFDRTRYEHQPRYGQHDDFESERRYKEREENRYMPGDVENRRVEETVRESIAESYRTPEMRKGFTTTRAYNKPKLTTMYTSLAPKIVNKHIESKSFIFGDHDVLSKRVPTYRYDEDRAHIGADAHMPGPATSSDATVVDLAKKFGASTFAELLATTSLRALTDSFTVFIPPNSAFTSIAKDNSTSLESILQYHIATEVAFRSELRNEVLIDTKAGVPVRLNVYKTVTTVSCVPIRDFDKAIASSRNSRPSAVGHVLDGVLTLPSGTILDIVLQDEEFSTLKQAVAVAGLTEALLGGPFTLFAPNNRAFNNLPYGVLDALLKNPSKLKDVLRYHIVGGTICNAGLETGPLKTLNGHSVTVAVYSAARINFSNVLMEDIVATNGVIHVIDAVLIPPATTIVEESKPHQQQFY